MTAKKFSSLHPDRQKYIANQLAMALGRDSIIIGPETLIFSNNTNEIVEGLYKRYVVSGTM